MSIENPTTIQMDQALDLIHDIAVKASSAEGIPSEVDDALGKIISLSRYKMNVLGSKVTTSE